MRYVVMVTTYNEDGHALLILGERYSARPSSLVSLHPESLTRDYLFLTTKLLKNLILLTSFNIVSLEQERRYVTPFQLPADNNYHDYTQFSARKEARNDDTDESMWEKIYESGSSEFLSRRPE